MRSRLLHYLAETDNLQFNFKTERDSGKLLYIRIVAINLGLKVGTLGLATLIHLSRPDVCIVIGFQCRFKLSGFV